MNIGHKIRKIRELRNYTQEYMAIELDMSIGNYSKLERDEIPLTLTRLDRISKILDVTVNFILEFEESYLFKDPKYLTKEHSKTLEVLLSRIEQLEQKLNFKKQKKIFQMKDKSQF